MATISKYPDEVRSYQADWAPDLAGQQIVGDIDVTVIDPTVVVDRVTHDGRTMLFRLSGGRSGRSTAVTFRATTSAGERIVWQPIVKGL